MVIPTHIAEKGAAPSFREREETRRFYTETLLHTESFTHKHFYAQTLSHRDVFHAHTHRRISTQRLLHENTLTHRRFYTQTLLHTYAFTCDAFLQTHTHFHTQTLLHTDAFTHRRFCIVNKHWHCHNAILELSRTAPTETSRSARNVIDTRLPIVTCFTNIQRTYKNMDVHSVHNASCLYVHVWAQERGKEVNYACRCRVAQSTAKHLLSDFQTENTTHEFDMTKNHCRRDLQTEGWTHQQKTSLTKFGNTIWNHLAMPCFILHHPGLPNWEHNSWVWHLGWASLSNTMML